jgi:hypothetical protein
MGVRMTEERKKPGVAFWITVALVVVLVGYPLSFGPVVRLDMHRYLPHFMRPALKLVYRPLIDATWDGPEWLRRPLRFYVGLDFEPWQALEAPM